MGKTKQIKRPSPLALVKDPDLQLSYEQTKLLAHAPIELRREVLGNVIGPKLDKRFEQELIPLDSELLVQKRQHLVDIVCDYVLLVHLLPIFGERTSIRSYLQGFEKQARKLHSLVDEENYCNLCFALTPAENFSVAISQVFILKQSLDTALAATAKSLEILGSNQLSVAENARQHLAWSVADVVHSGGISLGADPTSPYIKVLRACAGVAHAHPNDPAPDFLRPARAVLQKRKARLNGVSKKMRKSVEAQGRKKR